jgi:hypothetical protein
MLRRAGKTGARRDAFGTAQNGVVPKTLSGKKVSARERRGVAYRKGAKGPSSQIDALGNAGIIVRLRPSRLTSNSKAR